MSTTIKLHPTEPSIYLGFYGMCMEEGFNSADTDGAAQRIHLLTSQYDDGTGGNLTNGNRTDLTWTPDGTKIGNATKWDALTNTGTAVHGNWSHSAQYKYQFRTRVSQIIQVNATNLAFDQIFNQAAFDSLVAANGGYTNLTWEQGLAFERYVGGDGPAATGDADLFETGRSVPIYTGESINVINHNWWHMLPGKLYYLVFQPDPHESSITIPELYCTKVDDLDDGLRLTDECYESEPGSALRSLHHVSHVIEPDVNEDKFTDHQLAQINAAIDTVNTLVVDDLALEIKVKKSWKLESDQLADARILDWQKTGKQLSTKGEVRLNGRFLTGLNSMSGRYIHDDVTELYYTVLHEILHILGIGPFWNRTFAFPQVTARRNLLYNGNTSEPIPSGTTNFTGLNPVYVGKRGVEEYNKLVGGNHKVLPIEDGNLLGTSGLHLEEGIGGPGDSVRYYKGVELPVISHEIMTGYLNHGNVDPLTSVTLGMLEDLGYTINWNEFNGMTRGEFHHIRRMNEHQAAQNTTTIITTTTSPHVVDS